VPGWSGPGAAGARKNNLTVTDYFRYCPIYLSTTGRAIDHIILYRFVAFITKILVTGLFRFIPAFFTRAGSTEFLLQEEYPPVLPALLTSIKNRIV